MDNRTTSSAASVRAGETASTEAPGGAATGIVNAVKERATAHIASQKDKASDQLDAIATAVRQGTERLRNDQHDVVAQYVEKAADQLERLSQSLRNRELDDILRDVQSLARRQPALVIGGSFVAGMLAARFLKSSSDGGGYTPGNGMASTASDRGMERF